MGNTSVWSQVTKPTWLAYLCDITNIISHYYSRGDLTDQNTADKVFILDLWVRVLPCMSVL